MSGARSAHPKKRRGRGKVRSPLTHGAHEYHGKSNSRSKRLQSKIRQGVKPISREAWKEVEALNRKTIFTREQMIGVAERERQRRAR